MQSEPLSSLTEQPLTLTNCTAAQTPSHIKERLRRELEAEAECLRRPLGAARSDPPLVTTTRSTAVQTLPIPEPRVETRVIYHDRPVHVPSSCSRRRASYQFLEDDGSPFKDPYVPGPPWFTKCGSRVCYGVLQLLQKPFSFANKSPVNLPC